MNTAFLIYMVMQLDSINFALYVLATLAFMALIIASFLNILIWDDVVNPIMGKPDKGRLKSAVRVRKKLTAVFVGLILIAMVMPNTKTAIFMIGGSATIEVLQSPEAKEVGGKVLELLQKKLDEELGK